ncbi:hypothetical protein PF002_g11449 [Phytophthora fragariae]|uniref:Uncharacterized protein n=1 Tax=Phytophthora fragariae TaxID=53985 RepID=A0A6A3ZKI8_9STRA|nr:hypothetical protein PF002_g11449 [Phytophthora fragariae]
MCEDADPTYPQVHRNSEHRSEVNIAWDQRTAAYRVF